jgi:phosphatidylglycerophosphatase B
LAASDDPRVELRRFALVVAIAYLGVLSSFALPDIALDGWLAALAVRISDSASWQQLPYLVTAMVLVVISRPGLDTRRRALEAAALIVVLVVILAGNAQLNESVIKPAFAIPRPNLVALADQGALGLGVDEFYALGDKQARRDWLAPRLTELTEPRLAPIVREHWAIETGYSFPSGHATASMTFASLMYAVGLRWTSGWRRTLTMLLPIWAVAVVLTRPLLRVHTYLDVSFGAAVGIGLGVFGFAALHVLFERRARAAANSPGALHA